MRSGIYLLCLVLTFTACDNNVLEPIDTKELNSEQFLGTGSFLFDQQASVKNMPLRVYFHVPAEANANTPILVLLHGGGRDAKAMRDQLISEANDKNFIILSPLFDNTNYSLGDGYILGNVFVDGDNPSHTTLNPEEEWSYSVIDPLFDWFASEIESNATRYDVFGFSAGAQFVHRLLSFKTTKARKAVVAAAGWYTVLDSSVSFPYGIAESPITSNKIKNAVALNMSIVCGSEDNDPDAPSLRRNATVDLQGDNRLDRSLYYFQQAQQLSQDNGYNFNWSHHVLQGKGHDLSAHLAYMIELIY